MKSEKLTGFLPNFKEGPIKEFKIIHTMLSQDSDGYYRYPMNLMVFESKILDKTLQWYFYYNKDKNIYAILKIVLSDDEVTSYGTHALWPNIGPLTQKPLEYNQYSRYLMLGLQKKAFLESPLFPDEPYFEELAGQPIYVDVSPFLQQLLPIKLFKNYIENRKIE